jgi:inner membrane protein
MVDVNLQSRNPTNAQSIIDRVGRWLRESVMLKILSIGFLILILLSPVSMITGLVGERQHTHDSAVEEVSAKWGFAQTIGGPVLTVPYLVHIRVDSNDVRTETRQAHFLPHDLRVEGTVVPEIRYRGLYRVILYTAALRISGDFARPDFARLGIAESDIVWKDAALSVGVTDMRGIRDSVPVTWGEQRFRTEPGVRETGVFDRGVNASVPESAGWLPEAKRSFTVVVNVNGSRDLSFLPVGKETTVRLTSAWQHPSFGGAFLPDQRDISANGFSASWKVLDLNRGFPMQWTGSLGSQDSSAFGVTLVQPVDRFQKVTRATKYAALFVTLTFLAFLMVEVMRKKRLHPMQYLMVGLAVVLFYALVLSLSEHVPFAAAYLTAAAATVGLVCGYARAVVKEWSAALWIGGLLTSLYVYLYVLLQLEDYALLIGTLGLFVILGSVMFLTRKVDWYAISLKTADSSGAAVKR